jgi:ATP-dependent protease ClpP protease subunit
MNRTIDVDSRVKARGEDLLVEQPQVFLLNRFTDETCEKLHESLAKAVVLNQPVFPVIIDSYGGSVYTLLHVMDVLRDSGMKVATFVAGKAMSAGALLAGMGTPGLRFASPNATFMLHEVSSFHFGKVEEIKADADETDRLNKLIFSRLDDNCGHQKGYFLDFVHKRSHADWYLTAREAKKHNLIDHIRVPTLGCSVEVHFNFQ